MSGKIKNKIVEGDGDPRHGSTNGYRNHGCRCPECTAAASATQREYMHADPERARRHAERQRSYIQRKRKS